MDFLKYLLYLDTKDVSMDLKLKSLEKNIADCNSEYYLLLKYGIKPNSILQQLYQMSNEYHVHVGYLVTLFEMSDKFNLSNKDMLIYIKSELENLMVENINLIYKGHENDTYYSVSKEHYIRLNKYEFYIQNKLVEKYRLYKSTFNYVKSNYIKRIENTNLQK